MPPLVGNEQCHPFWCIAQKGGEKGGCRGCGQNTSETGETKGPTAEMSGDDTHGSGNVGGYDGERTVSAPKVEDDDDDDDGEEEIENGWFYIDGDGDIPGPASNKPYDPLDRGGASRGGNVGRTRRRHGMGRRFGLLNDAQGSGGGGGRKHGREEDPAGKNRGAVNG